MSLPGGLNVTPSGLVKFRGRLNVGESLISMGIAPAAPYCLTELLISIFYQTICHLMSIKLCLKPCKTATEFSTIEWAISEIAHQQTGKKSLVCSEGSGESLSVVEQSFSYYLLLPHKKTSKKEKQTKTKQKQGYLQIIEHKDTGYVSIKNNRQKSGTGSQIQNWMILSLHLVADSPPGHVLHKFQKLLALLNVAICCLSEGCSCKWRRCLKLEQNPFKHLQNRLQNEDKHLLVQNPKTGVAFSNTPPPRDHSCHIFLLATTLPWLMCTWDRPPPRTTLQVITCSGCEAVQYLVGTWRMRCMSLRPIVCSGILGTPTISSKHKLRQNISHAYSLAISWSQPNKSSANNRYAAKMSMRTKSEEKIFLATKGQKSESGWFCCSPQANQQGKTES